jgi:hypothetical protein
VFVQWSSILQKGLCGGRSVPRSVLVALSAAAHPNRSASNSIRTLEASSLARGSASAIFDRTQFTGYWYHSRGQVVLTPLLGYVRGEGYSLPRSPPINGLCKSRLCRPRLRPLR